MMRRMLTRRLRDCNYIQISEKIKYEIYFLVKIENKMVELTRRELFASIASIFAGGAGVGYLVVRNKEDISRLNENISKLEAEIKVLKIRDEVNYIYQTEPQKLLDPKYRRELLHRYYAAEISRARLQEER